MATRGLNIGRLLVAAVLLFMALPSPAASQGLRPDASSPESASVVAQQPPACTPNARPRVNVQNTKVGERDFLITLTAGQGNLELIKFGNAPTALIDLPNLPPGKVPPFDYKPPAASTFSFVLRTGIGTPVTLPLVVYDGCGQNMPWNTFVGAGQSATQAQLSIADASVTEGNSGTTPLVFTVSLNVPASAAVSVQYATGNLTATAPSDYTPTSGTLTFMPGETQKTITVQVVGDVFDEPNETFAVQLNSPLGASILKGSATGTINDDEGAPTVSLSATGSPVAENGGQATITATLSAVSAQQVTVKLAFVGTATFPNDYTRTGTQIVIPAGQTTGTVGIQGVFDGIDEADETVIVLLDEVTNATAAAAPNNQASVTITDGNASSSVSISNVTVTEGNSGTVDAVFQVTLSAPTTQTVTVHYRTFNGSATVADLDYVAVPDTTLQFDPGQTSKTVTVKVNGDTTFEADETFTVALSNPTDATLDQNVGTGTILNDDAIPPGAVTEPDVQISDGSAIEGDNAVFTVSLSAPPTAQVTVNFLTANDTAIGGGVCAPGIDYIIQGGILTFPVAGATTQTVTVVTCDNAVENPNKSFFVDLTGASANANIVDNRGNGTIIDDEGTPALTILDASGSEGASPRTFTVQVSPPSTAAIDVNVATADNTATGGASCATPGVDYIAIASTPLNIPANAPSATINVIICDDADIEPSQSFFVNLSSPSGAVIADGQATGTITNDDVGITIDDPAAGEAAGTLTFTVALTDTVGNPVTVNYATASGSAIGGAACTAGVDFVTTSGLLNIPANTASATIDVTICNDASDELNETFTVTLSGASGAEILDTTGQGTIVDDDGVPALTIDDVTVTEGDSGTVTATFTVTLSPAINAVVTVNYATANGAATGGAACGAGVDYVSETGTLTFIANDTSEEITIDVCGDALDEIDEKFFVNLAGVSANATIADGQGVGTITDDDATPTLSIDNATVAEGDSGPVTATFTVTLSAASGLPVSVQYITANDSGVGSAACGTGVDYVNETGTLTFVPGDTTESVTIDVCGDVLDEADETYFVDLSAPSNATILDGQGLGTITDDDAAPTLSINDVSGQEGNSGTSTFVFTVTLSAASGQTVTVHYQTNDGTANAPSDYTAIPDTILTFNPGVTSQPISVTVNGDTDNAETDQTFTVDLSGATNATILDGSGTGTILDDDNTPTLSVADVSQAEGTGGTTTFTFTVTLSQAQPADVTVDYATLAGTATAGGGATCTTGDDYLTKTGTLTFSAATSDTSKTIDVTVCPDAVDEANETFQVNLSNVNAAVTITIGHQGQGTIVDDDNTPTISITDASVAAEGNTATTTTATFTVSISGASGLPITVDFATSSVGASNPATAGNPCGTPDVDYVSQSNTLTFPANSTASQNVVVTTCGDATDEPNETFFVNLSNPSANATILDSQGIGTIVDDDLPPTISINDVPVTEGAASTTTSANFSVTLSNPSSQTVTVDFATANSTATGGAACTGSTEYVSQASGTVTFNAGVTSQPIAVTVCGDDLDEPNETFFVNLSNPSANATILDSQGLGTITDDDPPPSVSLSLTTSEGSGNMTEVGGTGTVTATLSAVSGQDVTVPLSFVGSTAVNPSDYTPSGSVIAIPAGSTFGSITLTAIDDPTAQPDLTIVVTINNPTNATIGAPNTVTATIVDNDPIALADSYAATGNLSITIPAGSAPCNVNPNEDGVLCNDTLRGATLAASTITSANGGTITMAADGGFTYNPPAGFTGADTFSYTVNRASPPGTATATVTVNVSNMIWFINSTSGCTLAGVAPNNNTNNCGRLSTPLKSVADMQTLNNDTQNHGRQNQVIFIYENASAYAGSLTLLTGQKLIGQDATDTLDNIISTTGPNTFTRATTSAVLPATNGTTGPGVTLTSSGNTVTVGSNNTIRGMTFGNASTNAITGSGFGSLTIRDASINTTGARALNLSSGTLDATFATLSSTNSPTDGITLSSLTNNSKLTVSGTTTVNTPTGTGRSINIDSVTGATSAISFQAINLGGRKNDGLRLNAVQGTVTATDITQSGTQPATGAGVLVSNSSAAITFKSVTQTGGLNAISLSSTTGSFTITGDGAGARNGSGGTIASSTGDGIRLATATKVSLSRMNINTSGSQGIFGTGVNGFVLDWASMTGNGNAVKEGAIRFGHETDNTLNGLVGTGPAGSNPTKIANSLLTGSHERNVSIFNSSGTLTQLDVDNNTIQNAVIGSGFLVETRSSATATVIVTRTTFQDNFAVGIQGSATQQSALTLKVLGVSAADAANRNTFTDNNEGVLCSNGADADATCEISNNRFTGQGGNAIFVGNGINLTNQAALNGRIQNNTVIQPLDPANANHAVQSFLSGVGAVSKLVISGNTITSSGQFDAIHVNTPDDNTSPNFHLTVTSNNASIGAAGVNAISLNARKSSTACFKVETNTTQAPSGIGVQVRETDSAIASLERGSSASNDPAVVLAANNLAATGNPATFASSGVAVVSNGTCLTPP